MTARQLQTPRLAGAAAPALPLARPVSVSRRFSRPMAIALALAIALAGGGLATRLPAGRQSHTRTSAAPAKAVLSQAATLAISRQLGTDLHRFWVTRAAGGYVASNAKQHLRISFNNVGATIAARAGARVRISLASLVAGDGNQALLARRAHPSVAHSRVDYARGSASEWFSNGPAGLEQGFTVASPPAGATGGALTLTLGVSGTLTPHPAAGGVVLVGARGKALLRYGDLSVSDAGGRTLPAQMTVAHGHVLIRVDARGARYPLTVDPLLVSVGELYASDGVTEDQLGDAVSASGPTVVVGDTENSSVRGDGSAYVFTEGAGGWATATQQTKLLPSSQETEEGFGSSVAISGGTIVVGAPNRAGLGGVGAGQAYVFTEPAGGWGAKAQLAQAATLIDGEDEDTANFGVSVAILNETIVVGAPRYVDYSYHTPGRIGAAFIFQEPAGGWANDHKPTEFQNALLIAKENEVEALIGHFGESVAIGETEGKQTVAVGGPGEPAGTEVPGKYQRGLVFLFNRPAGGWPARGEFNPESRLSTSEVTEFSRLGQSVSISGDTIAAGATHAEVNSFAQGATYVFTAPPGGWGSETEQTQAAKLVNPRGTGGEEFGKSVAVEGDTVVSAGQLQKIYLFAMPSAGWAGELQPSGEFKGNALYSVAISGGDVFAGALDASPPDETGHAEQGAVDVVPFAPAAVTGPASGSETTAAVEGTVNPDQTKISSCRFQYGTSSAYGSEVACTSFPSTGVTGSTVTATLTGLAGNTTYHYRVVASNEVDTSYGADSTFTTSVSSHEGGGGAGPTPIVTTPKTTTTPITTTPAATTPAPAPVVAPQPSAVLACGSAQIALINVIPHGSRVLITGAARLLLAGRTVSIKLLGTGKVVANVKIAADGTFSAGVPLPPASIRSTNLARYQASVGSLRSQALKLDRRMYMLSATRSGAHVLLSGYVTGSFKAGTAVHISLRVSCTSTRTVATVRLTHAGKFTATVPAPSGAASAIAVYRATTTVLDGGHRETTFTLPTPPSG